MSNWARKLSQEKIDKLIAGTHKLCEGCLGHGEYPNSYLTDFGPLERRQITMKCEMCAGIGLRVVE